MTTRIDYRPIDLSYQKIKKVKYAYLELHDDRLTRHACFMSEERPIEDSSMPMKEVVRTYTHAVKRSAIIGLDFQRSIDFSDEENHLWSVEIGIQGDTNWEIWFEDKSEAKKVYDQLFKYIFP